MITQKRLKEVLFYNKQTGIFVWKINAGRGKAFKGDIAGAFVQGYINICVDGEKYQAHRLAFLYIKGYFPENLIDHKNRIRNDNRWENLREVSQQCNIRNVGNFKHNKSGCKGVSWCSTRKNWISEIKINGKSFRICRTKDFTEAVAHRLAAEQSVDWAGCDCSSPAFKIIKNYVKKRNDRKQKLNSGSY